MTEEKIAIIIRDARGSAGAKVKGIFAAVGIAAVFFGPGILADSAAMQWAGFVLLIALIGVVIMAWDHPRLTIAEARKKLDELEAK